MGKRRTSLILLGCSTLLLAVALIVRNSGKPAPQGRPTPTTLPPNPPLTPTRPPIVPRPLDELRTALGGTDRESKIDAARSLRKSLMAFPERIKEAIRLLRDPSTPLELRRAIAVVLGSLPGTEGKRALLEALRDGAVAGLERTVILGIGIREFEDGEAFERDGQPYSIEAAAGLVVFVMGPLGDPEARTEMGVRLAAATAEERRAAALVLRDSTEFPEVRRSLLDRLGRESDGETTAEEAAALTAWSRNVKPDDAERAAVLSKVLDVVTGAEEVIRFRLTSPLSSTTLLPTEAQRVRELAAGPDEDARLFAMDVMGRRLGLSGTEDQATIPLLARAAVADTNADVREAAALALGRISKDPQALQALTAALRGDADWEVRAAAARSLSGAGPSAREALQAASQSDPHPDVRAAAQRSLK